MAEAQQEENHWPGFVDALSTIVMVVTFLLIILAVAIFALSLNIAKVSLENPPEEKSTHLDASKTIPVADRPVEMPIDAGATPRFRSANILRLEFVGTTVDIDATARAEVREFFGRHSDRVAEMQIEVSAYYDANAPGYTKQRRISYYRLMAVRNLMLATGFEPGQLSVFVREAPTDDRVDMVEIYAR
ncbi:MAG: hypothetical protein AAF986_10510 [Pseudomonadota bacterium]